MWDQDVCLLLERSSAVREAQQEGLHRNLSVATGRTQLQNAMRTYLVWVSFRHAASPDKNAHRAPREQLELHSMVWTGTGRDRQLLRAHPNTVHTEKHPRE